MSISNASVSEGALLNEPVRLDTAKVSWASIMAGLVVALGTWVLLTVLGLALGLSSADPNNPATSLKSAGLITGIWSLVVPFVALLAGGLVAARTAGVVTRPTGAIHGVVLWALATLASVVLLGYVVKGVVSGAAGLGANIASVSAQKAAEMGPSLGIRPDDILAPVNTRLQQEGKPAVTAVQLEATMKDVVSAGVRQGSIDHDLIVGALAKNTRLSPADADDVATRIEATVEQKRAEVGQDVQAGAAKAADASGKALWWVFLGMVIGLGSAVAGSTLGVSRRQRLAARTFATTTGSGIAGPILTNEPAHG